MRIILADDKPEVRSALRLLLEDEPGLQVVGEVEDAGDLAASVAAHGADLVLLDWELPGLKGADPLCALRQSSPHLRVVALSGRPEARQAALAAGATAFISKGDPPERVLEALRALKATPRSPSWAVDVLRSLGRRRRGPD